jgi:adenine-specific DNA-methyltransferase
MNNPTALLQNLDSLNAQQLKRLLVEHLTRQKLGLYWESNAIERDQALNAQVVLPRLVPEWSQGLDDPMGAAQAEGAANLIMECDNFDSLRLLKSTHAGRVRVIYLTTPATKTGCTTTTMWAPTTAGGTASGWSFCTAACNWPKTC